MPERITLSERQLRALGRAIASMNLVGARISVGPNDDLLSQLEMTNLEYRLRAPFLKPGEDEPFVEVEVSE